jgi:hypothetical protein
VKVDPAQDDAWRLGVCNDHGEVGLVVRLGNDRQVAAFIDAMVSAGFDAPTYVGSESEEHGCHYLFECAREHVSGY